MIKLSDRLNTIASLVEKKDNVIDIGCDHALLDIYLASKYNKKYIASDLRKNVLENAIKNVEKYDMKDKVSLICGDGLNVINDMDGIDTVIISGLGFQTIISILKNIKDKTKIKKLIIQSNSHPEKVRKFIIKNGFFLKKEEVVLEKNFYYIISVYERGYKKHSKMDVEVGLLNNSRTSKAYLEYEIKRHLILKKIIPITSFIKKIQINNKLLLLIKKINSIK